MSGTAPKPRSKTDTRRHEDIVDSFTRFSFLAGDSEQFGTEDETQITPVTAVILITMVAFVNGAF